MSYLKKIRGPGKKRILFGFSVVILLIFSAWIGPHLTSYKVDYMDSAHIMEPPSLPFFRSFLVTQKGLQNLGKNSGQGPVSSHTQSSHSPVRSTKSTQVKQSNEYSNELPEQLPNNPSTSSSINSENTLNEDDPYAFLESHSSPTAAPTKQTSTSASADSQTSILNSFLAWTKFFQVSHKHYFGTDKDGRDILVLLLAGAKTCLIPGLLVCFIALIIGVPLGIWSGYTGGKFAEVCNFFASTLLSFPQMILILIFICALEPNLYLIMGVLGLTISPRVFGVFKNKTELLKNTGFILAAHEAGLSKFRILFLHIFWYQCRTLLVIQFSLIMAESILVETTLSYLQFGTKPPDVSWGSIIEGSRMAFFSEYYWITFFPSLAITLSILGFYYLGDGLNARQRARENN